MSTDINNKLDALLEKERARNEEVLSSVYEKLQEIFPQEDQTEVIFDMYQKVFKQHSDIQELNLANIFLNSYIDSFYTLLVGEGKLLDEEQYREIAAASYRDSLETINATFEKESEAQNEE